MTGPDITELAPQNTHSVTIEDADVKSLFLLIFFMNLAFIHFCELNPTRTFLFPLSDDCGDIYVSQVGADSEAIGEVDGCTKKIEPAGDMGTHDGLIVQYPFDTIPEDKG